MISYSVGQLFVLSWLFNVFCSFIFSRQANTTAIAATDTVQLITSARDFEFSLYEVTDRDYLHAPKDKKTVTTATTASGGSGGGSRSVSTENTIHIQNPIAAMQVTNNTNNSTTNANNSNSNSSNNSNTQSRSNSRSTSVESTFASNLLNTNNTSHTNTHTHTHIPPINNIISAYNWVSSVKSEPDSVITVLGKETHFYQYVSQCDEKYNTAVKFDFCIEDSSGNGRR